MDDNAVDWVTNVEHLGKRADELRSKIKPLPAGDTHRNFWSRRGPTGNAYLDDPHAPLEELTREEIEINGWLDAHNLQQHKIVGDGKCQYRAVSRALFGTEEHHGQLLELAVTYLRLHKNEYAERVAASELIDRREALQSLVTRHLIREADYDGWCDALERGYEWGQDFTLEAMCTLMHTKCCVVHNLKRRRAEARIMCLEVDPMTEMGEQPIATIYLILEARPVPHYTTLEEKPVALTGPAPAPIVKMTSDAASQVPGSDMTAEDDPLKLMLSGGADVDEVTLRGDDYALSQLLAGGASDGNGGHFSLEVEKMDYVFYHQDRSGAREEILRKQKKKVAGPPKPKEKSAELPPPSTPVEILPDDINVWISRLDAKGYELTNELGQQLHDAVKSYIDSLDLVRSDGASHIDKLGAKMHEILETIGVIRCTMYCAAHSEAQPSNKVLVVGVEGAGKSTTLNWLLKTAARDDTKLQAHNPVKRCSQTFSKRYSSVPITKEEQAAIEWADEAFEKWVFDEDLNLDISKLDDEPGMILPTGRSMAAMTALVTTTTLDPTATCAKLSLEYRSLEEVQQILKHAEELRRQGKAYEAAKDGADDEMTGGDDDALVYNLDDGASGRSVDVDMVVHMVCDMIGGPDEEGELFALNPKEKNVIRDFEGKFELKSHQWALLGRKREMVVEAPTFAEMADQLRKWLTMHTVGKWSNWALLKDVKIVLPSETVSLTLADVPGFGQENVDVFRQSIVTSTFTNCECSTLYYCLKPERLCGAGNAVSAQRIDGSGLFEQLFGDENALAVRSLGSVVTSLSLDWSIKEQLEKAKAPTLKFITREAESAMKESKEWLKAAVLKAGAEKGIKAAKIDGVLEKLSAAFALDVKGTVNTVTGCNDYAMKNILSHLNTNAKASVVRRQKGLFNRLVFECLLPFYSELEKMGALRAVAATGVRGLKPPDHKRLLIRMQEAGETALIMGSAAAPSASERDGPRRSTRGQGMFGSSARTVTEANAARRDAMYYQVMAPKCAEATKAKVDMRFQTMDLFEPYRRPRCHALGNDLKSDRIELTKLKDLIMPEVANQSVYPLQEALRELKDDVISAPQRAMQQVVVEAFEGAIEAAVKELQDSEGSALSKEDLSKLESLSMLIIPSLQKFHKDQIFTFDNLFTQQLATLPKELMRIIRVVFLKSVAPIANATNNKARAKILGENAGKVATEVSKELLAYVQGSILDVMHARFREDLKKSIIKTCVLFAAAVEDGETKDFERLQAFTVSHYYSRFAAGLIVAVSRSGLATVDDYPNYDEIVKLAEQPSGFLSAQQGEGLKKVLNIEEMESNEADEGAADDGHSMEIVALPGSVWPTGKCPQCGAAEADINLRDIGKYNLAGCTKIECWCKRIEPSTQYCKLCVNYFKRRHLPRSSRTEEVYRRKKRKSLGGDLGGDINAPTSAKKSVKMLVASPQAVEEAHLYEVDEE